MKFDYKSKRWRLKREAILRRDGYECQLSKRYGKNVCAETVHHIWPVREYPQYAFCDWNLISITNKVHESLHDRENGRLTAEGERLRMRTPPP